MVRNPAPQQSSLPPVPRWARPDATRGDSEDVAFQAGAALAALQARIYADAPFAGAWRRRLALKAAAASVRMARRSEHEDTLRDVFFLRGGGDDAGPAGRMLIAWRALDRSAPLEENAVARVVEALQLKMDDALRSAIAGARQLATSNRHAPQLAAQAASGVFTQRPDAEILALWIADAILSSRAGWPIPLPLVAAALMHPSLRTDGRRPYPGDGNWIRSCTAAYGRAAVEACDLYAELERQSQKLIAAATQLRAKRADAVIDMLHNEDAVLPSALGRVMSDRAARRVFDRLVALGAVRELTGRSTFRLYGL
jgi:Protein of unknown function (DUF1403)